MESYHLDFDCVGIDDGGIIPIENTGRGQDRSPEFLIWNLSPNAATLAITLEDLTHPIRNFTHWIIWNIPASNRIKSGIPAGKSVPGMRGARQGPPPLRGPQAPQGPDPRLPVQRLRAGLCHYAEPPVHQEGLFQKGGAPYHSSGQYYRRVRIKTLIYRSKGGLSF